jgi:hypothetical protein
LNSDINKFSTIKPENADTLFLVDKYGRLMDILIRKLGDWAQDRIANQLPINYSMGQN